MSIKTIFFILFFVLTLSASERIIALSPSINEIVFALGAEDKVVGNTTFCDFPKEAVNIPKVGGYFNPSLEKILSLNPTLVIMQENNTQLAQKLARLGIQTKIIKIEKLADIKNSIAEIGEVLGKKEAAKKIVSKIDEELTKLTNITANKRVMFVFGHNTSLASRIFVAGQNLYFDDIINESGNKNALQSQRKGQPILNMENIIACNPDIVILLSHSMKEMGLSRDDLINPWLKLPINAGKTNFIYIIDKTYSGIPSDRLVYFLQDFREILNDYKSKSGN
ncbi:MAG: helical backbone metal receptor [Sulfurimonas sp.]